MVHLISECCVLKKGADVKKMVLALLATLSIFAEFARWKKLIQHRNIQAD